MNDWIDVNDKLPDTLNQVSTEWTFEQMSKPVLVDDGYSIFVAYFVKSVDPDDVYVIWKTDCGEWRTCNAKFWRPLPPRHNGSSYLGDLDL